MEEIAITVVGAGVIGLAVAREVAREYEDAFLIERNPSFGQEISSRNSEVIHAGIYYPKDSLKTKSCLEGKELLYDFCARNNIPFKKTGKLIVAVNRDEMRDLELLFKQASDNGVSGLQLISHSEIKKIEPNVSAEAAINSPSTGIIDSHSFMKRLAGEFEGLGGKIAYNTEVIGIEKTGAGYEVSVNDAQGARFKFLTDIFINCAGLDSDKIAEMGGIKKGEYKLKYCKGDYFRVHPRKARFINRLVYPVPKKNGGGLGIHATVDLAGGLRLGPDDEYVKAIDYKIDAAKAKLFYESAKDYMPFIELQDLAPDMSGIRPKLQGPGDGFRDFIIKEESENNLEGFINLIGIESPGLTASLYISGLVKKLINKNLIRGRVK